MIDLETQLRSTFAQHHDSVRVDRGLLDGAIRKGNRRIRVRRAALGVAAVLAVIGSAVGLASLEGDDRSEVAAGTDVGHWSTVEATDPDVFSGDGDTYITAVTPWKDQVVVLGVRQPATGDNTVLAWTSDNGIDWERHELDWPTGCDPNGGLVARGDQLLVTCRSITTIAGEDVVSVDVATTADLARWTVHHVTSDGQWFGSLVGSGPGDTVTVQALAAQDPDTTVGARTRVWSSSDLTIWTEMTGETVETFLDGQATAIRTFDEVTIITGMVNDWPAGAGPDEPAVMRPAVWVSTAAGPFRRTILDTNTTASVTSGNEAAGVVMDVAATSSGYVAVGSGDGGSTGLAWTSTNLSDWTVVSFGHASTNTPAQNGLRTIVSRSDGTLLAAGDGTNVDGLTTIAWQSTDRGRSWRPAGRGPSVIANWNDRPVGMSSLPGQPRFWTWEREE